MTKYESGEYQKAVSLFVQREVIYNVSTLISELTVTHGNDDEFLAVLICDDYKSAAIESGWEHRNDGAFYHKEKDDESHALDWQDLCSEQNIDPHLNEAYEHWIVSGWLADKLEAKGEMILRDFMGLTIWGRTCTGQSIMLDRVICDIYDELHKAAGDCAAFISSGQRRPFEL